MRGTLVAGLLMVAALSTPGLALAEIGRIKSVTGTASVVRGKAVTPAAPGFQLMVSDVLTTGATAGSGSPSSTTAASRSARTAGWRSASSNSTTPPTRAFLTTVDRGALGVVSGQIAKENKDAMKVRTPTSLLAARGTTFVVEVK